MLLNDGVNLAGRRAALLASTAFFAAALAVPAQAQGAPDTALGRGDAERIRITSQVNEDEINRPSGAAVPHSDMIGTETGDEGAGSYNHVSELVRTHPGRHNIRAEDLIPTEPVPQIVISNPGTSTTARDSGVTGVGQMVFDQQNGFIGLCTGSLINPRTVLFAAHCVNDNPATDYGAGSGGRPVSFGFAADNLPALQRWFNATIGGQPNPLRYQSNPDMFLYNVSQIKYNDLSLEPESAGFLYGDVAIATLDTPAGNVPTWALLFSPLPDPGAIGAAGTGYNVEIVGYGSHGNASTGSASGSDFRRRTAENIIGALTDLETFESFVFGAPASGLTQNLYFIDFDDPRRGLSGVSPFDFNAFRDNARVTDGVNTEGITASGDSGGPLILQNFGGRELIAGVLSGGYTRFFAGQPANGYGTVSFYQPLYLYWDWIAANNPYRYVTNLAGDRLWTDASNWVTQTDPNYFIIGPDGQVVNGVPTDLGLQKDGTDGDFGKICLQGPSRAFVDPNLGVQICYDTATGEETLNFAPIGTEDDGSPAANVGVAENNSGTQRADTITARADGWVDDVAPEPQADGDATAQALPPATIENGLPGAINFVPNNVDPVRETGAMGRYFDVALLANGTTTLNSAVTIDRFSILGSGARLNITSAGSLTSLMDVRQLAGVMIVNGTLTTPGDFLLAGGGLMGNGRINSPFTTNVLGTITPGTDTTIGTLTFGGNLVLSSGSQLFINIGAAGASDRIAVVRSAPDAGDGMADIGGLVTLARVPGANVRAGDLYTILTAEGGVTGQFTAGAVSAILRADFIYNPNSVQVEVTALPYADVVNAASGVQTAYATLLDRNRGNSVLAGIYDILDLVPDVATIQGTLEALAPRTEALRQALGIAGLDNNGRLFRDRIRNLQPGDLGGRLAYYGRRIETAALAISGLDGAGATMSDVSVQPVEGGPRLPETMGGFVAAGYLDGRSAPMTGALPAAGDDEFDGLYFSFGLEHEVGERAAVGVALSYTNLEGTTAAGGQTADGQLYLATVYGKTALDRAGIVSLDGQLSVGMFDLATTRPGDLPGQTITLRSNARSLAAAAEVGIGALWGERVRFGPRVAARASTIDFGRAVETGGPTALVLDRDSYSSLQGRAGLVIEGAGRVRPNVTATYVHEFDDAPTTFGANFVGGTGGNVLFNLASQDKDWFEVAGGIAIDTGNIELSISADTTIDRDDVENQSYRASVKLRF